MSIDLSRCDYYRGVGPCTFGCRDEPKCQTMIPNENGWPIEFARQGPAAQIIAAELGIKLAADEEGRKLVWKIADRLDKHELLVEQVDPSRQVDCDQDCGAVGDPENYEEAMVLLEHMSNHTYKGHSAWCEMEGQCPGCEKAERSQDKPGG